ncbi:unnamed protein product [Bursaphelenchus xylophilus]|uniref:(pine wood nematode) hypothetical protein n=1 Tax=Bursaphelenchus xylophilus TaxID=6326 RepID=A0A1I7SWI6_BURXY|nr:unnamed protein product [Bursaphelenchus xylophilus]CAG9099467.1 unnamed protein product [Bursaphelenchus xylophilus]
MLRLRIIIFAVLIFCVISGPLIPKEGNETVKSNRPDHLKAVPLERDGELNKDLRKELLLSKENGGDKHEDSNLSTKELIELMFRQSDTNKDGKLSQDELFRKVKKNIRSHLDEGKKESNKLFQLIDKNANGLVDWDEYKNHFMVKKNMASQEHVEDHQDHDNHLDSDSRFALDQEKYSFKQADADGDGLDEMEWLSYQHPENSKLQLNELAQSILKSLDTDKNGYLDADEFAQVPPGVVEGENTDRDYQNERRKEFEDLIDQDKDGKVMKFELVEYLNPLSDARLSEEVKEIFVLADHDDDGFLTLKELMDNSESLALSSFIRPKMRLHDDL